MRASLAATVEVRGDATVVHVAGSLGVSTAPVLRTTVLECLAAEPALIVLDVAELRAHDDVALTVLPALAQHAAAWPGSAVSMAAAPAPLRSALDRMAVARQIPLFATTDAAIAHGGAGTPGGEPPGMRARLQPMVDATAAARHLVDRACRSWGITRVADLAELIVTELVSNGVRHARTDGLHKMKKIEKISEDEKTRGEKDIQKATDDHIRQIDQLIQTKEAEVMAI